MPKKKNDYEVGGREFLNAKEDGMIHIRSEDGKNDVVNGYKHLEISSWANNEE